MHIKNILDPEERRQAQIRSQGPARYQYQIPTIAERSAAGRSGSHAQRAGFLARPGTFLATAADEEAAQKIASTL